MLDEFGSPIFGKQLLVQAGCGTCSIVHWISPNCESSPEDGVRLHFNRWNIAPDFSPVVAIETPIISTTIESSSAAAVFANSLLIPSTDSHAGFPNSIATYAHGIIRDNSSSSRAKAAAIYAVLTISPRNSEVTIYTDSQTAIDGL
ncbi:hypothetical protein RhiirA5_438168 [Rhizophagus irregularis]|uniref:Uncharacterized protein n=1 Tax=Rhizophagus irregularis TaxID=588596 RepID=A0A2N0NJG7_9GLOM|nr:hypothetical protein RhiirA5_438168 [Rhizophagus irregularis]